MAKTAYYPSSDDLRQILCAPLKFKDSDEEALCKKMVDELSPQEQEAAARTSYAYWVYATQTRENFDATNSSDLLSLSSTPLDGCRSSIRNQMAWREARRHLAGESGDYTKGMKRLRLALALREEWKFDLIRSCFTMDPKWTEDEAATASVYRGYIEQELGVHATVIRGHDRDKRAILIKMPRRNPHTTFEAFAVTNFFFLEKAFACTEYCSRGEEERVVAVGNCNDYSMSCMPTKSVSSKTAKLARLLVAERVERLVIIDAPGWIRNIFKVISAFMNKNTRAKVNFLTGETDKNAGIRPWLDVDQAMPFLLKDGQLSSDFDVLKVVEAGFHLLYDDA